MLAVCPYLYSLVQFSRIAFASEYQSTMLDMQYPFRFWMDFFRKYGSIIWHNLICLDQTCLLERTCNYAMHPRLTDLIHSFVYSNLWFYVVYRVSFNSCVSLPWVLRPWSEGALFLIHLRYRFITAFVVDEIIALILTIPKAMLKSGIVPVVSVIVSNLFKRCPDFP